ncbi:MAG: hypothetical protein ACKO5F_04745 [Synechococcus sp.]
MAAADRFLRHPLLAWFSLQVVGILPIERPAQLEGALRGLAAGLVPPSWS